MILYLQIPKTLLLNTSDKTNLKISDKDVNKIENRITFEIKAGYYLELLTPETIKVLESSKSKTTKDDNGENVSHLEINEVILVQCNFVSNTCQNDSRVLCTFVSNKSFGQL